MIRRRLESVIRERMFKGKAILVLGPRQTGKTTLLKEITKDQPGGVLWLDGDEPFARNQLTDANIASLKSMIGNHKILVVDEAQQVKNIGYTLKLITDHIPEVQLMVSGSSSLDLAEEVNEPLTGRKFEFFLYPLSFEELRDHYGILDEQRLQEQRLIYGSYPEVITTGMSKGEILGLIAGSYLYKDIFKFKDLRRPELLDRLLQALALQLGSEISYHELAQTIGANTETIQRYIELLEKTFVIFTLCSFSRNLRNELKKSYKVYFYDNGIRNALISNFSTPALRTDRGALWENYLISERKKYLQYTNTMTNTYFWRTRQQQEIDYLEEKDGILNAYEFKWNANSKAKLPLTFSKAYPDHRYELITSGNYSAFLSNTSDGPGFRQD